MSTAGNEPAEIIQALLDFLSRIAPLELGHAVSGSVASSLFGEPRPSADCDVVVDLPAARLDEFVAALGADYYVPRDSAMRAIEAGSSFNVIHLPTSSKIDIFVAGKAEPHREQLQRRVRQPLVRGGEPVWLFSPEVMVVAKLSWFRRGGGVSDRQWRDVLGILKVQAGRLDEAWMRRHAAALGVSDLLERALRLQGQPPQ
ncbi:MAG TPA: hypothetical protein VFY71_15690 [Planctomycetota bacterium]|nr:hypothetical protein [Planctomycetota bacterium]